MKKAMVLMIGGAIIGGFGIWWVGTQDFHHNVAFMLRGLFVLAGFIVGSYGLLRVVPIGKSGKDGE
ncbi:hypothetical protein LCGC14_0861720 [marine sediment metagenome]|uniref:Uncharacterized protein n=1 Tax=marine sediment metagenome TaxID=412755 RepID=A0A0F9RRS9_9ZZZZ